MIARTAAAHDLVTGARRPFLLVREGKHCIDAGISKDGSGYGQGRDAACIVEMAGPVTVLAPARSV